VLGNKDQSCELTCRELAYMILANVLLKGMVDGVISCCVY
jgi:hypothetical protein